jgi:hypothetical protein
MFFFNSHTQLADEMNRWMDWTWFEMLHCLRINSVGLIRGNLYIECIQAAFEHGLRLECLSLAFVRLSAFCYAFSNHVLCQNIIHLIRTPYTSPPVHILSQTHSFDTVVLPFSHYSLSLLRQITSSTHDSKPPSPAYPSATSHTQSARPHA